MTADNKTGKDSHRNYMLLLLFLGLSFFSGIFLFKSFTRSDSAPVYVKDFELTMHDGTEFNVNDLAGKWTIVFFGYMNCPDICPATLQQLKVFYTEMQKFNGLVDLPQVVFVSVDSARDKPGELSEYVHYFHKDFIGATGNEKNLTVFSKQLDAFYKIKNGTKQNYDVIHSADIYIIDPSGKLVDRKSPPFDIKTLVAEFAGHGKSISTLAVNSPVIISGYGIQ